MKSLLPALIALALALAPAAWADPPPLKPGLNPEVELTLPSPLASNRVLAERFLSPRMQQALKRGLAGKALTERPLDLAHERFIVYLPKSAPPEGYGLLVYVPPSQRAELPLGWAEALDRAGIIFISADRSGNAEDQIGRRDPLALEAAWNMAAQFRIDPARTYVGGFSGGSRVAMRIALAYPDVFRGALLDAGSDPIGDEIAPLPAKDLTARFQTSSAVVMTSGEADEVNTGKDHDTAVSLKGWCVQRVQTFTVPHLSHEVMSASALTRALQELGRLGAAPTADASRCLQSVGQRLQTRLNAAGRLKQAGDRTGWLKALDAIDRTFGGLAAPESLGEEPAG